MCEKLYENDKVHTDHPINYIYYSVCNFLIFTLENNYRASRYRDNHFKRYINEDTISNEYARRKDIL